MKDDVVIVLIDASLFLYFGDNGSGSHAIHAAAANSQARVRPGSLRNSSG